MTISVMTEARRRLITLLTAAAPDATVTENQTVDRTDKAVVYVKDASASESIETFRPGQARGVYEWSLELEVESQRWHGTAAAAQDAVAGLIEQIDAAVAGAPTLPQSGDPANGLPGLDWVRVSEITAPKADHGAEEPLGNADQWQAGGLITLLMQTRKR